MRIHMFQSGILDKTDFTKIAIFKKRHIFLNSYLRDEQTRSFSFLIMNFKKQFHCIQFFLSFKVKSFFGTYCSIFSLKNRKSPPKHIVIIDFRGKNRFLKLKMSKSLYFSQNDFLCDFFKIYKVIFFICLFLPFKNKIFQNFWHQWKGNILKFPQMPEKRVYLKFFRGKSLVLFKFAI